MNGCLARVALHITTGLCAGVALEFRPPVTAARLFMKINNKNQCLVMLVKPEQKPGYAELPIAPTSSRTCTKPTVIRSPIGLLCRYLKRICKFSLK